MKRLLALVFAGIFGLTMLTGCETMEGMGRDVENAGEEIEDASD